MSTVSGGKVEDGPLNTEQPAAVMDRLNERMTEVFGHRWTSQFPRDALDTWAKGLADMDLHQIKRGVEACVAGALAWPPTLPEFRELCLTVPGLPTSDEAWTEAEHIAAKRKPASECSHPAIWHAYRECGDLGHMEAEKAERKFRRYYAIASRDYAAGKPMADIPPALPPPDPARELTVDEQAERDRKRDEALAKLAAMFPSKVQR